MQHPAITWFSACLLHDCGRGCGSYFNLHEPPKWLAPPKYELVLNEIQARSKRDSIGKRDEELNIEMAPCCSAVHRSRRSNDKTEEWCQQYFGFIFEVLVPSHLAIILGFLSEGASRESPMRPSGCQSSLSPAERLTFFDSEAWCLHMVDAGQPKGIWLPALRAPQVADPSNSAFLNRPLQAQSGPVSKLFGDNSVAGVSQRFSLVWTCLQADPSLQACPGQCSGSVVRTYAKCRTFCSSAAAAPAGMASITRSSAQSCVARGGPRA